MSAQAGQKINATVNITIDNVVDKMVIELSEPNADQRIAIYQVTWGCQGNAGAVPAAGNISNTFAGLAILQRAKFIAGQNYGITFPAGLGSPNIGEYLWFDSTGFVETKTINFYPRPLLFDPGANGLIVGTVSAIAGSTNLYASIYGEYVKVPESNTIAGMKLR